MSNYRLKPLRKMCPEKLLPFLPRWQSNNGPDDLGVVRFIFDLFRLNERKGYPPLIKDFKLEYGVAPWAKEALAEYFQYYIGQTKEDRCFVFATYREGSKRQPLDANILTPTGWKKMGDINVGDYVIGSDGKPTKVVSVSDIIFDNILKVKTEDGKETECDPGHLWYVRKIVNNKYKQHTLKTTQQLIDEGIYYPHYDKRTNKIYKDYRYAIDNPKPIEFPEKELPIEPYVLGLILGDGHIGNKWGNVLLSFHREDESHYRKEIEKYYNVYNTRFDNRNPSVGMFNISGKSKSYRNELGQKLKELDLRGRKSHDKFIPEIYKNASIEQRRRLLTGLMDTDGTPSNKGDRLSRNWSFSTVSEKLADDVVYIVRSLGGTAYKSYKKNNYNGYYIVRMTFTDFIPFSLPRKRAKCILGKKSWARIVDIEYVGQKFGKCIKVENPDGLYVTDDFLLTHNTFWFSFAVPLYEMLVGQYGIYYGDTLFPEVDYQVLKGKTGKEAKKRLLNIANFLGKPIIRDLFGNLRPSFKEVKDKVGKDQSDLLILPNGYIYEAAGIDQPVRGFNLLNMRPKKITYDDPENKENTKTEARRRENQNEVMQEAFGALADVGSLIYIGNKIHADDTIGKLLDPKNKQWKKQFHTFTYIPGKNGEKLPGKGNLDVELPDWPARYTIEHARKRKEWYEGQPELGGIAGFLKEYYNIIKSEGDFIIKEFHGEYVREHGINWLKVYTDRGVEYRNVNIYIGNDPAISERDMTSNASVVVLAVDAYKRRYILDLSVGKFDIHDRYKDVTFKPKNGIIALTQEEMRYIKRIGSAEECVRKLLRYNADGIAIEIYGQQMTFYNETKDILDKLGKNTVMLPYHGGSDSKITRIRQLPLAYFESGLYHIKDDLPDKHALKVEIETFPYSKLDILDSVHIAEKLVTYPKHIEYDALGMYKRRQEEKKRKKVDLSEVDPWIVA